MADYYPLIASPAPSPAWTPVLPASSRRALYERARTALIAQLRSVSAAAQRIRNHPRAAVARRGRPQGQIGRGQRARDASRGLRGAGTTARGKPPPAMLSAMPRRGRRHAGRSRRQRGRAADYADAAVSPQGSRRAAPGCAPCASIRRFRRSRRPMPAREDPEAPVRQLRDTIRPAAPPREQSGGTAAGPQRPPRDQGDAAHARVPRRHRRRRRSRPRRRARPTAPRARPTPTCRRRRRNSTVSNPAWNRGAMRGALFALRRDGLRRPGRRRVAGAAVAHQGVPSARTAKPPRRRSRSAPAAVFPFKTAHRGRHRADSDRRRAFCGAWPTVNKPVRGFARRSGARGGRASKDAPLAAAAEDRRSRRPAVVARNRSRRSRSASCCMTRIRPIRKGKQYVGSVVWRTEPIKAHRRPEAGDIAVRADIEIPDRKFKMTMSFRRNTDTSLPASHTAELTFVLPPDFAGGGVANVPGVLMKSNEQARGHAAGGSRGEGHRRLLPGRSVQRRFRSRRATCSS